MIRFNDNTELTTVSIYETNKIFQGQSRQSITFVFTSEVTFDALSSLFGDENTLEKITIYDDTGIALSEKLHYSIPVVLMLENINGVNRYKMELAQKSALEIAQKQQAVDINDTQMALIELADMITEV